MSVFDDHDCRSSIPGTGRTALSNPIEESYKRLEDRAAALQDLVDQKTDPQIKLRLQKAYASLKASAALLLELEDQSHHELTRSRAVDKNPNVRDATRAAVSTLVISKNYATLLESGVLLSEGRDVEAIKHLALEVFQTGVKIGIAVSGAKLVKDAAELIGMLEDLAKTGQAFKFRKKQIDDASNLLRWAEAISVAALIWNYAVERYLLDISGNSSATADDVLNLMTTRIVKASQGWTPKLA
jgi:hypothetical protein